MEQELDRVGAFVVAEQHRRLAVFERVRGFRRGRHHVWELEPDRLAKARDYLERIDAQWDSALERLEQFPRDE